jgi:hypothetical protein
MFSRYHTRTESRRVKKKDPSTPQKKPVQRTNRENRGLRRDKIEIYEKKSGKFGKFAKFEVTD